MSLPTAAGSPLASQRELFAIPADVHYVNCAYMAPLARSVETAGCEGVRRKSAPWLLQSEFFFQESEKIRTLFGRLIDAPSTRIAIHPAASYGLATVRSNLKLHREQNIVVAGEQFPSNYYPWSRLARESGAQLRVVAAPDEANGRASSWNVRLLEAIDSHTGLVALPVVHWADGTLFDLAAIGQRARELGACFVVDGTQSVGSLPFSVAVLQPDALICAGYKTLFGPYGSALAYYSDRFEQLADGVLPLEDNWINRRDSENFAGLVNYQEAYRNDASKFDAGERSNFITLPMLKAALQMVLEWQPTRVAAYCRSLVHPFLDRFRELGLLVEEEGARADHLLGLRFSRPVDLVALADELATRRVYVSIRGSAVRLSPQVYNEPRDLEALIAALAAVTVANASA